jgi:hypothetical protein
MSVYRVIAVWIPVTSVPTSSAAVAIATFITEVSSVIKNWPVASVSSTTPTMARAPEPLPVILGSTRRGQRPGSFSATTLPSATASTSAA